MVAMTGAGLAVSRHQERIIIDSIELVKKVRDNPTCENVRQLGETLCRNGRNAFGVRKCILHMHDSLNYDDYHVQIPNRSACSHCPFYRHKDRMGWCPTFANKKSFPFTRAKITLVLIEAEAILQSYLP